MLLKIYVWFLACRSLSCWSAEPTPGWFRWTYYMYTHRKQAPLPHIHSNSARRKPSPPPHFSWYTQRATNMIIYRSLFLTTRLCLGPLPPTRGWILFAVPLLPSAQCEAGIHHVIDTPPLLLLHPLHPLSQQHWPYTYCASYTSVK
jgi:hypothetical protein